MDDDTSSNNINVRAGAHLPKACRQLDPTCAIFTDSYIADVSEVEFTFSPCSVRNVGGIPMTAGRCAIGCTTIAFFMDMNGVDARRCVLNFDNECDCITVLCENCYSGQITGARRTDGRNRLFRWF